MDNVQVRLFFLSAVVFLITLSEVRAQNPVFFRGRVINSEGNPVEFALIRYEEGKLTVSSDSRGTFLFPTIPGSSVISVRIGFVGKKTIEQRFKAADSGREHLFRLEDLSLTLDEVTVTPQFKHSDISNSSITFDRQAIEQVMAFSLSDVLNMLPGKKTLPPTLHNPTQLTLRSNFAANGALSNMNNAFGTAIIMDGITLSNDANMQNRNVGKFGLTGSTVSQQTIGSFDVPFSGIDLRDIPADNIERIEVVQGVASAEYGNLTDGAVIIDRQAGHTPYLFNVRTSGASVGYAGSKGFSLGPKAGAVNLGFNQLNSINDPRTSNQLYKRTGLNVMWTVSPVEWFKNTFSVDYNYRNDDRKPDEDDSGFRSLYARTHGIRIGNRSTISVNRPWLRQVGVTAGYSDSRSETKGTMMINSGPRPVADKDTSGIYEGYYIPGTFTAVEHIKGRPVHFDASVSLSNSVTTGRVTHNLTAGSNINYSDNLGEGVVFDPSKPRWANQSFQNERPYSYDLLPAMKNFGAYVQDQLTIPVGKRQLQMNAGLRMDVQNGYASWQPRINTRFRFNEHWQANLAFGKATKAPSMAHRYPGPVYFDIPLLNAYTGDIRESVALYLTEKITPDNSNLRPSRSTQLEGGVQVSYRFFRSSLFAYYKRNEDGFSSFSQYLSKLIPEYRFEQQPDGSPGYEPTGDYRVFHNYSYSQIRNDLYSESSGVQWMVSIPKIRAIQTSFDISNSFSFSYYRAASESITAANLSYITAGGKAWYGIYQPRQYQDWDLMSKVSSITHIPRIGFVVTLQADVFWRSETMSLGTYQIPVAYYDQDFNRVEIPVFDENNTDYNYLLGSSDAARRTNPPWSYVNLSLSVAKEIRKNIRISVHANNVLNIRHQYYNPISDQVTSYVYPMSIGGQIAIRL